MGDPGRLIAFEGVEGAGKSTQLELLRQALEGRRARDPDRIEAQDLDFHRRVRDAFRDLAAADPERFTVLDATAPVPEIATRVRTVVLGLLEGP